MNLAVQNVDFSYFKKRVFKNFDIDFNSGINIIIGSNGSGKTTLLKLLAGVYSPKGGQITFNGKKYSDYKDIRKLTAYIPQEFDAYSEMKVKDFLAFIAEIKLEKKSKYLRENIDNAIAMTNIEDFTGKKIKELSGGMKKRVGIAQALVSNAQIIIADEPTADLDPEQCELFNRIVKMISGDKIIIISTHIIQDIHSDSDQIYVLSDGVLKFRGTNDNLQSNLKNKIYKIDKLKFAAQDAGNIKILDEIEENGKIYLKVAVEDPDELSADFEQSTYTSADIWRYYK